MAENTLCKAARINKNRLLSSASGEDPSCPDAENEDKIQDKEGHGPDAGQAGLKCITDEKDVGRQ